MRWVASGCLLALGLAAGVGCSEPAAQLEVSIDYRVPATHPLAHARRWAYVIQQQTEGDKLARLARSGCDVVVLDDPRTLAESATYDAAADVSALHATNGTAGKRKVVLAYLDIGEAESYRTYWRDGWGVGAPDFVLAADPDGWEGNYPVAYWAPAWHDLVYGAADSLVARVVADGYDGIYLDWIEAASFDPVIASAAADGVDPQVEMVRLIAGIRDRARAVDPDFLVVAQNAIEMRAAPGYLELLDGQAQEQVFFDGLADVYGDDPRQGDCRLPLFAGDPPPADNPGWCAALRTLDGSSEEYVRALGDYLAAGVPVFTVDYALERDHAEYAYAQDARFRFVGLVTMRSLEDLTSTPPPGP